MEFKESFANYIKQIVIEECQGGSIKNYYEAQSCLNFCEAELARYEETTPVEQFVKTIALFYPTIAQRLYHTIPAIYTR